MQAQAAQAAQGAQGAQVAGGSGLPVPPPPPTVVTVGPDGQVVLRTTNISASEARVQYQALRSQRSELRSQLDNLEEQRQNIIQEMRQTDAGPARAGLEQRLAQIDQRIASVDRQIATADEAVAKAAAMPGATVQPPQPRQAGPPEEFWVIAGLILVPSAFILTIAYARRIWRRGAAAVAAIPQEVYDRFTRVEQAIDSVAVEVERIGEGQRYLTRVLAERQLGAGPVQPLEVKQREGERVAREK